MSGIMAVIRKSMTSRGPAATHGYFGPPAQAATTRLPRAVEREIGLPGQPLEAATRAYFEPRFGQDFRDVRVHSNDGAAISVGATAYAVGRGIVKAPTQTSPEAARTAGSRADVPNSRPRLQRKLTVGHTDDALEIR
jgi:hypothetical protein